MKYIKLYEEFVTEVETDELETDELNSESDVIEDSKGVFHIKNWSLY